MEESDSSPQEIIEFQNVYSPSSLLGIFANAIRSSVDGRLVLARGLYQTTNNQREYSGYYYDDIKSLNDNKSIRAKVPALLRSKLQNNQIYTFKGYIEKKINFSAIELVFVIDEVLQKEENPISEEDLKRFRLLQQKSTKGFQDLEAMIKTFIYKGEVMRIANLYGNTAIVHKDFEKGLAEASVRFEITEHRCNFGSKTEIISALTNLNKQGYHAIALVRGGGDKASLEVFNDPELGEAILKLKTLVISALGHTVDETLTDKLADKKFALPHDYGNSLKVWVDNAIEEQNKSKSIFIEQVKQDLNKTFQDQITTLQTQLQAKNKEYEIAQEKFKEIYENTVKHQIAAAVADMKARHDMVFIENQKLNKQAQQIANRKDNFLLYIIIAIIVGLIIGLLF